MKKTSKILLTLLMVLGIFSLTGCGKKTDDLSKYVGIYKGEYTKFVGDSDEHKVTDEDFSVELKKDGTGVSTRSGSNYNITWSIDGENFKMNEKFMGLTNEYNGTLKDGKIDIYNGDKSKDITLELVYKKQ